MIYDNTVQMYCRTYSGKGPTSCHGLYVIVVTTFLVGWLLSEVNQIVNSKGLVIRSSAILTPGLHLGVL